MKKIFVLLFLMATTISGFAEFRIWTDQKGNMLEAELEGVDIDKIVLKSREGKKIVLSPLSLCASDQEYLKGKIPDGLLDPAVSLLDLEKPPRLEIEFKKVTDTKNNIGNSSYRDIDMISSVMIVKKNSEPYSGKLTANLYVIGFRSYRNHYVMLDTKEHEFTFSSKREITFQGEHITFREYKYDSNYSMEYNGYLVVISSEKDEVLAMRSSTKKFEENYGKIKKIKKGIFFDKHFNETGENSNSKVYY